MSEQNLTKKILNIVSGIKGKDSFSTRLADVILEKIAAACPSSEIRTRDLTENPLPHITQTQFIAFNTPAETRTDKQTETTAPSDEAVRELLDADIIVIGVPLYNFGIPSTLKSWIDHIARAGLTFSYAKGYPEGLVTGKKVYLALATGGIYSEGPMKSYDFAEPYLRSTLGFLGMTDITAFRIEGTMMPDPAETAVPKALSAVSEFAF